MTGKWEEIYFSETPDPSRKAQDDIKKKGKQPYLFFLILDIILRCIGKNQSF
jgi:hypothetical protein